MPNTIDGNVSDLFFNLNHSDNAVYEDGKFSHYDDEKLNEEAKWFCSAIARIGGPSYEPADVIADFYKRL